MARRAGGRVSPIRRTTFRLLAPFLGLGLFTAWRTRHTARCYPPAGRLLDVGDTAVHVVERGRGKPVVLLHGLRGSTRDFEHSILDALASRYHVLAVDRPGYGHSTRPREDLGSPLTQAELLHRTLARLGVHRPLLVGHSMGAVVALAYASCYPHDTAALVTISGHVLPFDGGAGPLAGLVARPLLGRLLLHFVVTPLGLVAAPALLRRVFAPQRPPAGYARAATLLALRPASFRASSADRRRMDAGLRLIYKDFPRLRRPAVLVAGRADRIISPNESLSLQRIMPRAELVVLPGVGHMAHFAAPQAVLRAVDRAWQLAVSDDTDPETLAAVAHSSSGDL